uniref:Uncharacterized protein n=1 Tax=Zea mays TaxID=4577 RepID=C0PAU5_MAIZE|nr:unknown [Zea mays]
MCLKLANTIAAYTYHINSLLETSGCLCKELISYCIVWSEESMRGLSISQAPECIGLVGINLKCLLQFGFRIFKKLEAVGAGSDLRQLQQRAAPPRQVVGVVGVLLVRDLGVLAGHLEEEQPLSVAHPSHLHGGRGGVPRSGGRIRFGGLGF